MHKKIVALFKSSKNPFKGLEANLIKGDHIISTKTLDVHDSTILLKNPRMQRIELVDGDVMQLHIKRQDSAVYPVRLISHERNTLALELL